MTKERHFYHGASRGLESDILFKDEQEFIAGMNRMAICLLLCPGVLLFAHCLMDNHIHVILYGSREDCTKFLQTYKKLTGMWLVYHGKDAGFLDKMEVQVWLVPNKEKLVEKIIYIFRNPVVANMPFSAQGYRWSSASAQFTDSSQIKMTTRNVGELSVRKQRELFATRVKLPENWRFFENGMIWSGNYVEVDRVNSIFGTPQNFQFNLCKKVEAEVNLEIEAENVSLPDSEMIKKRDQLLNEIYESADIKDLTIEQRINLAKTLKEITGCSYKQTARLVHIPFSKLQKIFY